MHTWCNNQTDKIVQESSEKSEKTQDPDIFISTDQTLKAIKKAKNSKAMGPDGISPNMLKHLGPYGIIFLSNIFNCSVNQAIILTMWKTGQIILLLTPKNLADKGPTYRLISSSRRTTTSTT